MGFCDAPPQQRIGNTFLREDGFRHSTPLGTYIQFSSARGWEADLIGTFPTLFNTEVVAVKKV